MTNDIICLYGAAMHLLCRHIGSGHGPNWHLDNWPFFGTWQLPLTLRNDIESSVNHQVTASNNVHNIAVHGKLWMVKYNVVPWHHLPSLLSNVVSNFPLCDRWDMLTSGAAGSYNHSVSLDLCSCGFWSWISSPLSKIQKFFRNAIRFYLY